MHRTYRPVGNRGLRIGIHHVASDGHRLFRYRTGCVRGEIRCAPMAATPPPIGLCAEPVSSQPRQCQGMQ